MQSEIQSRTSLGFAFPSGVATFRNRRNCTICTQPRIVRRPRCTGRVVPILLAEPTELSPTLSLPTTRVNDDTQSNVPVENIEIEGSTDKEDESTISRPRRRKPSLETRRKISSTMLGVPKSAKMRAKLSASMKKSMENRPPWNKGKTLSAETRKRMSISRKGRAIWNKGVVLTEQHKRSISAARLSSNARVSDSTRQLLKLARRRPGDGIVTGAAGMRRPTSPAGFPLIDTKDIHAYVTLRRSLRGWSDAFAKRNGHRPTIADVRRTARPNIIREFEQYVAMRGAIRGLAADVCGSVNPADIPVVPSRESSSTSPQNNNARRVHITTHGNRRLVSEEEAASVAGGQGTISFDEGGPDAATLEALGVSTTRTDMWDAYDAPLARPSLASGFGIDRTLFGAHVLTDLDKSNRRDRLSAKDYRTIGRYRLLESKDICTFVQLRRELERWSAKFKKRTGQTPKLSDVRAQADCSLYTKFCRYLDMRRSMSGLMKEVYGGSIDDLENTYDRLSEEAQSVLDLLRARTVTPSE